MSVSAFTLHVSGCGLCQQATTHQELCRLGRDIVRRTVTDFMDQVRHRLGGHAHLGAIENDGHPKGYGHGV